MSKEEVKAMTGEMTMGVLKKEVKAFGNTGHVLIPKRFVGDNAEIKIKKKWIICRRCSETFMDPLNFSSDERYCKRCFEAIKFLNVNKDKLKCGKCHKKITEENYQNAWDEEICPNCWVDEAEAFSKKNTNMEEDNNQID